MFCVSLLLPSIFSSIVSHRLFMTRSSCSSYLSRCSHSIFTISFSLRVRSISLLMDSLVSSSVSSFSCCLLLYYEEEEGRPPLTQLSSFWHHNLSLKMTGGRDSRGKKYISQWIRYWRRSIQESFYSSSYSFSLYIPFLRRFHLFASAWHSREISCGKRKSQRAVATKTFNAFRVREGRKRKERGKNEWKKEEKEEDGIY